LRKREWAIVVVVVVGLVVVVVAAAAAFVPMIGNNAGMMLLAPVVEAVGRGTVVVPTSQSCPNLGNNEIVGGAAAGVSVGVMVPSQSSCSLLSHGSILVISVRCGLKAGAASASSSSISALETLVP